MCTVFIQAQDIPNATADQELKVLINNYYGQDSAAPGPKCGFERQVALRELYNSLSPELQKAAAVMILNPPERQISIQSPSGKFTLHYDTSGKHSIPLEDISQNGIPDFIDSAGVILDYCWQKEVEEFGFTPPREESGEPVSSYNVYFTNFIENNYYGLTSYDSSEGAANWVTYLELNNDFTESGLYTKGLDALRVTAAHEFFHAIQLTYNLWDEEIFFYEMSSVWMEETIYPDINDYFQYLPMLFNTVQSRSLFSGSNEYGNSIFLHMLSKKHGLTILKEIWEQTKNKPPSEALSNSLNSRNNSLTTAINDYGKWMYYTGSRSVDGQFFTDADSFPLVAVTNNLIFDGNGSYDTSIVVNDNSFKYIKAYNLTEPVNTAKIESGKNSTLSFNILNDEFIDRNPSAAGLYATFTLDNPNQDVVFVVSNGDDQWDTVDFIFSPESDTGFKFNITVGPNPVVLDNHSAVNFYSVPMGAKVFISDINQKLIRKIKNDTNLNELSWDLKDSNGNYVRTGIYYFIIKDNSNSQFGKIAVIR